MLIECNHNNFPSLRPLYIVHWIVPDVVVFLGSIAVIILIRKASTDRKFEQELKTVLTKGSESSEEHQRLDLMTKRRYKKLKTFGILSTAASLCMSGIVHPSILNGIYFLSFLGSSTWLSCNRTLGTKYAVLLRILSVLLMSTSRESSCINFRSFKASLKTTVFCCESSLD